MNKAITKNRSPNKAGRDSIRTFLCIEIPDSVKSRIDELQSNLRKASADVGWVNPSNIHLTLKFLGAVSTARTGNVIEAARKAASVTGSFRIRVEGAGCFPSNHNPRVLWIGLAQVPEPLLSLYRALEERMALEGFARETRAFSPHLTIGRMRSSRNAHQVAELLIDSGFPAEEFEVAELIVMRSDLKPSGAVYTPLSVIRLGSVPNLSK